MQIIPQPNQTATAPEESFLIGDTEVFPVEMDTPTFSVTSDTGETFLFISAGLPPDQARAEADNFLNQKWNNF